MATVTKLFGPGGTEHDMSGTGGPICDCAVPASGSSINENKITAIMVIWGEGVSFLLLLEVGIVWLEKYALREAVLKAGSKQEFEDLIVVTPSQSHPLP